MTPLSRVKAPKPSFSIQQVTPRLVTPVSKVKDPGGLAPSHPTPQLGHFLSSNPTNPIPRSTPVISVNKTTIPCPPSLQAQVSPVTRGNQPGLALIQTSQASAASLSSHSANTHPTSNKANNSFKRLDYTPPSANSSTPPTLSPLLTPAPGCQAGSVSRPFLLPVVPAGTAAGRTPAKRVGGSGISVATTSGIPVTIFGATRPSSAPLLPQSGHPISTPSLRAALRDLPLLESP